MFFVWFTTNGCVENCPGKMKKVEMSMANDLNSCVYLSKCNVGHIFWCQYLSNARVFVL